MLLTIAGAAERSARVVGRAWRSTRRWQRGRPFWAGVLLVLASVAVLAAPYATVRVGDVAVTVETVGGMSALVVGVLLAACGVRLWLRPRAATATGVVAMVLALVALVTTNLGGFLVGSLLAVVGGAFAVAWTDRPRTTERGDPNGDQPGHDDDA